MIDYTKIMELGSTAIIAVVALLGYQKIFTKPKETFNGTGKAILDEMKTQNSNHLVHLQECMTKGFDKIAEKQDKTNELLFELLGLVKSK